MYLYKVTVSIVTEGGSPDRELYSHLTVRPWSLNVRISREKTMATNKQHIPEDLQRWIDARKRFHLSDAQVQMAREMGMNPRKLGGLANHDQEPWKAPLPAFIEHLYQKRFGKAQPDRVLSIEDRARELAAKKAEKREQRQRAKIPPG
jgi:hypothetical protein